MSFRAKCGLGRAIAAPQIGVLKRIVYRHIDRPWLLLNPSSKIRLELGEHPWQGYMQHSDS